VYEYKDAASKPRILYQPDPEYSEATHAAGYFGDAVFSLVVTPQGKVRDVKIVTPAGFGLDEEGIKRASKR
jgi:Gram-negative bacterial TonB protein C-terminal